MAFDTHEPGAILRRFTPAMVDEAINSTSDAIRAALRSGKTEKAMTLITKKIGLRICRGMMKNGGIALHAGSVIKDCVVNASPR
jgi:hypothetical protein